MQLKSIIVSGVLGSIGALVAAYFPLSADCSRRWTEAEEKYAGYEKHGEHEPYSFNSAVTATRELMTGNPGCALISPAQHEQSYRAWESRTIENDLPLWINLAGIHGEAYVSYIEEALSSARDSRFLSGWPAQKESLLASIRARSFAVFTQSSGQVPDVYEQIAEIMISSLDGSFVGALENARGNTPSGPVFVKGNEVKATLPGELHLQIAYEYTDYVNKSDGGKPVKVPSGATVIATVSWQKKPVQTLRYPIRLAVPDNFQSSTGGMEYFTELGDAVVKQVAKDKDRRLLRVLESLAGAAVKS